MKILIVSGSLPPSNCGVGAYVARLADTLAMQPGLEVAVAATLLPSSVRHLSWTTEHVGAWSMSVIRCMHSIIKRMRPDVVHFQFPTLAYGASIVPYVLPAVLGNSVRTVQTWHEPLSRARSLLRYLPAAITRDTLLVTEPDYDNALPRWYRDILARKRSVRFVPVGSSVPQVQRTTALLEQVRQLFGAHEKRLLVHFGIRNAAKGTDKLFDIANPEEDRIVVIGELLRDDPYHQSIHRRMTGDAWRGKAFVTGYVDDNRAAELLVCADAAVFPFVAGAGQRNTSLLAAQRQGVFVATTSKSRHGYSELTNTYHADLNSPDWQNDMRAAITTYSGKLIRPGNISDWQAIAEAHLMAYSSLTQL